MAEAYKVVNFTVKDYRERAMDGVHRLMSSFKIEYGKTSLCQPDPIGSCAGTALEIALTVRAAMRDRRCHPRQDLVVDRRARRDDPAGYAAHVRVPRWLRLPRVAASRAISVVMRVSEYGTFSSPQSRCRCRFDPRRLERCNPESHPTEPATELPVTGRRQQEYA
jgi:hypothetical protein